MSAPKAAIKDSDVHVTYDDQQQINTFARNNARLQDLKEEIAAKKKDLQNLEDAGDELLMLDDEDEKIPFQIGEVFMLSSTDETNTLIEAAKENLSKEISSLEEKSEEHKKILSDLKAKLYAKFGTNINLEAEEE